MPATLSQSISNIAASSTDASVIAAVPGKCIAVCALVMVCGGTATTITFNSKGSGAGTAISALFANGANGGAVMPETNSGTGWFITNVSEALTCTTGAGSTTGIQVLYKTI